MAKEGPNWDGLLKWSIAHSDGTGNPRNLRRLFRDSEITKTTIVYAANRRLPWRFRDYFPPKTTIIRRPIVITIANRHQHRISSPSPPHLLRISSTDQSSSPSYPPHLLRHPPQPLRSNPKTKTPVAAPSIFGNISHLQFGGGADVRCGCAAVAVVRRLEPIQAVVVGIQMLPACSLSHLDSILSLNHSDLGSDIGTYSDVFFSPKQTV
ncbi:hypothetical protein R6Q59_035154 [Mikania micrantha]